MQSGTPVNVTIAPDRANIGITGLQRPNLVGAVPDAQLPAEHAGTTRTCSVLVNCYDAAAFALPAQFTFGNAARNMLRGPKSSPPTCR